MRFMSLAKLRLAKNAPTIAVGAGIVGMVAAGVWASYSTYKHGEQIVSLIKSAKNSKEVYKRERQEAKEAQEGSIRVIQYYRDQQVVDYLYIGGLLAKAYGGPLIIAGLSAASILTGHIVTLRRVSALSSAYGVVKSKLENLEEAVGDVVDNEVADKIKEAAEQKAVDDSGRIQDGKTYDRMFGELNRLWKNDAAQNLIFLKNVQEYFNDMLNYRGWVMLSEVYAHLGLHISRESAIVGWYKFMDDPYDDTYIDFGLSSIDPNSIGDPTIRLRFNPTGVIYDMLDTEKTIAYHDSINQLEIED